MPGTIYQELLRILNRQKASGNGSVWVSPENFRAFMSPAAAMGVGTGMSPVVSLSQTVHSNSQGTGSGGLRDGHAVVPAAPCMKTAAEGQGIQPIPSMPQTVEVPVSVPGAVRPSVAGTSPTGGGATPSLPLNRQEYGNSSARVNYECERHLRYRGAQFGPASQAQTDPPLMPMPDPSLYGWDELREAALQCHACRLYGKRNNVVIEDGCRQARVMFIGEGPGEDEDRQGVPFVGRAGQLLTRMILAMGLDRTSKDPEKSVYIANIVKCRPPGNRNPEPEEGDVCIAFLKRQIELVQPKVIILLGAVPLRFLMKRNGITSMRGNWLKYNDIPVMPTFHPAYLLRFERFREKFIEEKRKVWSDLQQVMALLNLPRPVSSAGTGASS